MEMSMTLYQCALVGHVIGITLMAGAAFIDFAAFRVFWKTYQTDPAKAAIIANYFNKLQRFIGIGMLLILISGVLMMVKMHEIWGSQLWFRIKMGILLLVILNGLGLRRIIGAKMNRAILEPGTGSNILPYMTSLKNRLLTIQTIQVLLFVIIYVLSIFKFN